MQVFVAPAATDAPRIIPAASVVRALAFSPDGETLAIGYANGLCRWSIATPDAPPIETALAGTPVSLTWHPEGRWLTAGLGADGFCLVDVAQNRATARGNFPAPVSTAVFGRTTATVVAAGAYRVAAWSLETGGDVMTGKPGLVLINAVAASPNRNLVAVGYANGLLSLAEIGQPSEILLREDTGAGVTAMAWSPNGNFLALAGSDGSAALVEFPDAMFKS
jgi:WD40 repeat protein